MEIIHYNRVGQVVLETTGSSIIPYTVRVDYAWYGSSFLRGKFAVYDDKAINDYDVHTSTRSVIDEKIRVNRADPSKYKKIFVSSSCLTPRDLFRKSFSIVRNPEYADCIVVPDKLKNCRIEDAHIVMTRTYDGTDGPVTDLLLGNISYNFNTKFASATARTSEYVINKIKERCGNGDYRVLSCPDFSNIIVRNTAEICNQRPVMFIPDVKEYEDILLGVLSSLGNKKYVYEHQIAYDAPVNITPDTLWIWRRHESDDLLMRSIASSDWQKYPLTMSMFFMEKFGRWIPTKRLGPAKVVWDSLDIPNFTSDTDMLVEPDDLEMFQSWIFKELGINGNSGFADPKELTELNGLVKGALRKKVAVSKIKITQPTLLQSIKQNC